jgi:hypothetical protein
MIIFRYTAARYLVRIYAHILKRRKNDTAARNASLDGAAIKGDSAGGGGEEEAEESCGGGATYSFETKKHQTHHRLRLSVRPNHACNGRAAQGEALSHGRLCSTAHAKAAPLVLLPDAAEASCVDASQGYVSCWL